MGRLIVILIIGLSLTGCMSADNEEKIDGESAAGKIIEGVKQLREERKNADSANDQ